MSTATEVKAEFTKLTTFPLTVYITGEGKVKSSPGSIACVGPLDTGTCTESLEGKVTLTGELAAGYVLAGLISCKRTTATECEVEMTAAREVTAVFLKEGKEGPQGAKGSEGLGGAKGERGPAGPTGPQGPAGNEGAAGAAGAHGKEAPRE